MVINGERKEFEVGLLINDKGKKIRFFKREKGEVEGKNDEAGEILLKKFQFERDGKNYQILINVGLERGFFKNRVFYDFKLPPNVDYEIIYQIEPHLDPPKGEKSKMDSYVRLVNEGRVGNIVLLVSSILILIIAAFIIIRKKLKNTEKN